MTREPRAESARVVIVGGGPAGLAAAAALGHAGVTGVLVLEREAEAGGVPRHCDHQGFGFFDLRRLYSGPTYARRRRDLARGAGARILTATTALGWTESGALLATGPDGPFTVAGEAVLLATGCRERPRAARLVPGDRPAGVYTTGSLQQLVHLKHVVPGRRAVVVGAEHVSYSAAQTLFDGGCEVAALVTDLPRTQTYWPVHAYFSKLRGIPLKTSTRVARITGGARVEAVEFEGLAGGRETLACDTVVFTADWIPDHELARHGAVPLDEGTRGPAVDARMRTRRIGVFAAGNGVHAAEMADHAALGGVVAARAIVDWLRAGPSSPWTTTAGHPLRCGSPLTWICPNVLVPGILPRGNRYVLRAAELRDRAALRVEQDGRTLHVDAPKTLVPGRAVHLAAGWEERVARDGGAVVVTVV